MLPGLARIICFSSVVLVVTWRLLMHNAERTWRHVNTDGRSVRFAAKRAVARLRRWGRLENK